MSFNLYLLEAAETNKGQDDLVNKTITTTRGNDVIE